MSGQATAAGKDTQMPPSGARIAATVRADVRALAAYPVAEATGCIKLDAMECPYELPEAVREDIARAVRDTPLNRYPSADLSALQQAVRAAFGVPDAAGLLFGNGSDELIHIAIQACCAPAMWCCRPGRPSSISTWRRASTTPASSACR